MTQIAIKKTNDELILEVQEHATGSVKCCAAISALCYTLKGWSENNEKHLKEYSIVDRDGYFKAILQGDKDAETAFDTVVIGLELIAYSYPQYCNYKEIMVTG